jgi:hypothetical protein
MKEFLNHIVDVKIDNELNRGLVIATHEFKEMQDTESPDDMPSFLDKVKVTVYFPLYKRCMKLDSNQIINVREEFQL